MSSLFSSHSKDSPKRSYGRSKTMTIHELDSTDLFQSQAKNSITTEDKIDELKNEISYLFQTIDAYSANNSFSINENDLEEYNSFMLIEKPQQKSSCSPKYYIKRSPKKTWG